jgi:hypothetical protein
MVAPTNDPSKVINHVQSKQRAKSKAVSSTPPVTECSEWKHRKLEFSEGKLGFTVNGCDAGLKVTAVLPYSQASERGVEVGDFIVGVNDYDIKEVVQGFVVGKKSQAFGKHIISLHRPLFLTTYRAGESNAVPRMVREISGSSVQIAAGQTFKHPVFVAGGCDVQFSFCVEEYGCDIQFSLEREGESSLIHPYFKRNNKNNECDPLQLTVMQDSHLVFVFDNSHSWVRQKSLSYTIHVEGAEMSQAEKHAHVERQAERSIADSKLAAMGIGVVTPDASKRAMVAMTLGAMGIPTAPPV